MNTDNLTLNALFQQLGLDDSDEAIAAFVEVNSPLPLQIALHNADIWNDAQTAFLKEAIADDSDWSNWVDHLDAMLREHTRA